MSKTQTQNITRHGAYSFIRTNINYIRELPAPDEGEWLSYEVSEGVQARLRACLQKGIIHQCGRHATAESPRYYYETDPRAYRDIQHVLEAFELSPCGHTGVQNLGDGEYSCGYEFCDGVFGRGDALRMLE